MEAVGALLARHFISVKVDRESMPDVDRVYMTFVQATTGGGGWYIQDGGIHGSSAPTARHFALCHFDIFSQQAHECVADAGFEAYARARSGVIIRCHMLSRVDTL